MIAVALAAAVVVAAPGVTVEPARDVAAVAFVSFVAPTFHHRLNTRFDDDADVLHVARAGVAFDVTGRAVCEGDVFVIDGDATDHSGGSGVVVAHVHAEVRGCRATNKALADRLSAELTAFRKAAYTRAVDVRAEVPALKDADPARLASTITLAYDEPLGCGPVVADAVQDWTLIVDVDGKHHLLHQLKGKDANAALAAGRDVVGNRVGAVLTPAPRTITAPPP